MQNFDLKIDGESVPVKNGRLFLTFDTAADGFTAQIVVNKETQTDLYDKIKPYQCPDCKIYIESELKLTGKITKVSPVKTTDGVYYDIAGWSNTFNFVDSSLTPPYEYAGLLKEIAEQVAQQTGTKVFSDAPDGGKFERVTVQPGQSGFDFIAPLAEQRQQVVSSSIDGNILLQQADLSQRPVGTIEENSKDSLLQREFTASYDIRKRFRTYKVIGARPDGNFEAIATDSNINQPRHKLVDQNDEVAGGLEEVARYQLKIALIEALKQQIPVVGWVAPNNSLWQPGTLVTIVSETLFIPDGFTYLIRSVEFELTETSKQTLLTLIPKEVYSNEPIKEPWF